MTEVRNPYAPPTAPVADPIEQLPADTSETFIPNGRRVSAGAGARWIRDAWWLFKARPGRWLLISLPVLLVYFGLSRTPAGSILNTLLWPFSSAAIVTLADHQRRTGTFRLGEVLAGFRKPVPLLVVGTLALLSLAALYVSYAVVIGIDAANQIVLKAHSAPAAAASLRQVLWATLLYMIAALPISAATYAAIPLIMLRGLGTYSAIKMSFIGSMKNIVPGVVCGACAIVMVVVSLIPVGLGLFVSVPILLITNYTLYRDIFSRSG